MICFDTSALLNIQANEFQLYCQKDIAYVPNYVIEELEEIANQNGHFRYCAKQALLYLTLHYHLWESLPFLPLFDRSNDFYIFGTATRSAKIVETFLSLLYMDNTATTKKGLAKKYFLTYSVNRSSMATVLLSNRNIDPNLATVMLISDQKDEYKGYREAYFSDNELADFYKNGNDCINHYQLLKNEYLLIRHIDTKLPIVALKWNGEKHTPISFEAFKSTQFGKIVPIRMLDGDNQKLIDPYQQLLFDSLYNNQMTLIKGKAGSGKTYIALSFLFYKLERHEIDKIVIFCNAIATLNSARLGFLPGTKDEKLLDAQIGNLLNSKIGDRVEVERLINDRKIELLPMSDIRGYDTKNKKVGVYITEAQNADIQLMKLCAQRVGEDCIFIVDGDYDAQVDYLDFSDNNNGMRRLSEVFRGQDFYGEVTLKNIYRSRIASIADLM